jgi:hypothetical protein
MKTNVNFYEFRNWFNQNRPNNFSADGLVALFDYFEQYEEDCGIELEFDPIAICCEYNEYENMAEFHKDYDKETYPDLEAINDATQLITLIDGGLIILAF